MASQSWIQFGWRAIAARSRNSVIWADRLVVMFCYHDIEYVTNWLSDHYATAEANYLTWIYLTEKESECLTNPSGNGYHGTMSMTANDLQCIPWTSVQNVALVATLDDYYIAKSQNYCRHLGSSKWKTTSCFTTLSNGQQIEQPCKVDYCRM